jgi:Fe2+ transport system protein FeoA
MTTLATTTCSMCGAVYDPAEASGCASCPLGTHCSLSCCPTCGFTSVDVSRSRLARLARRLAAVAARRGVAAPTASLAGARRGERVSVLQVAGLPRWQESQLASYGVTAGRSVEVLQTRPVVVVRVDHLELALERAVADGVRIADRSDAEPGRARALAHRTPIREVER